MDASSVLFNRPLHACRLRTVGLGPWTARTRTRFVCRCCCACEQGVAAGVGAEKVGAMHLVLVRASRVVSVQFWAQVDQVAILLSSIGIRHFKALTTNSPQPSREPVGMPKPASALSPAKVQLNTKPPPQQQQPDLVVPRPIHPLPTTAPDLLSGAATPSQVANTLLLRSRPDKHKSSNSTDRSSFASSSTETSSSTTRTDISTSETTSSTHDQSSEFLAVSHQVAARETTRTGQWRVRLQSPTRAAR